MSLLVLSGRDVEEVVAKFAHNELVDLMAKVFIDLAASSKSQVDKPSVNIPHRSTISSSNHNVLFMPARLAPLAGTAIKIVSVPTPNAPPDVRAGGLPASTMVLDEHTGRVAAVMNAAKLTALRNAAST
jgi:ornithine cyclodeaminase/alanine dehydrogenase-like protein (mu-crystallin family)